jgi:L-seryl-tRNA(Ser) seleniumtransferase
MGGSPSDVTARQTLLRGLPSIDELLQHDEIAALGRTVSRPLLVEACRRAVDETRAQILSGQVQTFHLDSITRHLNVVRRPNLRPVLNATGVVLHTNLGRAPLSKSALERISQVAGGYCNLELELDDGERGSRYAHVVDLLCRLTGAEAAIVVNNCAAATVLTLSALAGGREVIVSRGEQVEIGGGFRMPDVMRQSGCVMVEVGTTNRTRVADYAAAITPTTGLLLKVHRSNFAVLGFTEEASNVELVSLGRARQVPVFVDLGSGALEALHGDGLTAEPTVRSVVASGASVVAFSADKLLGGPQAGVLVGDQATVERLSKHPLNRALRVDKLTIAALEATLEHYRDGDADTQVPTRRLLLTSKDGLKARADSLASALAGHQVRHRVVESTSRVGGGSMPLSAQPSFAVAIEGVNATSLHDLLRAGSPAIVGRICDDELWLDVRCLSDTDGLTVASLVAAAVRGTPP